jgi:hypothetical protein
MLSRDKADLRVSFVKRYEMDSQQHSQQHGRHEITFYDLNLAPRVAFIKDGEPTGMQIAEEAGFAPTPQITVLQWLKYGLEDIRPTETVNLLEGNLRFIVAESDGNFRFIIDGVRYDWPAPRIPVSVIRTLVSVPTNKEIFLVDPDRGEIFQAEGTVLDLSLPGVENLVTKTPTWKLNVQGVVLTLNTPKVKVRQALGLAGVDANQGWHIFLIVQGQDKREVALDDEIDLTAPGIEKLRLTPKDVSNGEANPVALRQFRLMPADENYLDSTFQDWQAILENGRQWVILPSYHLPVGYSETGVSLAIEVPTTYPMQQIDMFYVFPAVVILSGTALLATEHREAIQGKSYQRWSRHRGANSPWRPGIDNVMTHLALVESALLKEVQV